MAVPLPLLGLNITTPLPSATAVPQSSVYSSFDSTTEAHARPSSTASTTAELLFTMRQSPCPLAVHPCPLNLESLPLSSATVSTCNPSWPLSCLWQSSSRVPTFVMCILSGEHLGTTLRHPDSLRRAIGNVRRPLPLPPSSAVTRPCLHCVSPFFSSSLQL